MPTSVPVSSSLSVRASATPSPGGVTVPTETRESAPCSGSASKGKDMSLTPWFTADSSPGAGLSMPLSVIHTIAWAGSP